jgi:hypothetical protein
MHVERVCVHYALESPGSSRSSLSHARKAPMPLRSPITSSFNFWCSTTFSWHRSRMLSEEICSSYSKTDTTKPPPSSLRSDSWSGARISDRVDRNTHLRAWPTAMATNAKRAPAFSAKCASLLVARARYDRPLREKTWATPTSLWCPSRRTGGTHALHGSAAKVRSRAKRMPLRAPCPAGPGSP